MNLALLAIICLIVSAILAVINGEGRSASLWGIWAIACAIILGSVTL